MRRVSWLAEELLASQEGLCCMELVTFQFNSVIWTRHFLQSHVIAFKATVVKFNWADFTTGDSFCWPTLLECINYAPWRWPFKGWNMSQLVLILTYLLTAIGLTPGGSTVHIYTQTMHRTTQLTTLFGRLSGIRTQIGQTKINDELTA